MQTQSAPGCGMGGLKKKRSGSLWNSQYASWGLASSAPCGYRGAGNQFTFVRKQKAHRGGMGGFKEKKSGSSWKFHQAP